MRGPTRDRSAAPRRLCLALALAAAGGGSPLAPAPAREGPVEILSLEIGRSGGSGQDLRIEATAPLDWTASYEREGLFVLLLDGARPGPGVVDRSFASGNLAEVRVLEQLGEEGTATRIELHTRRSVASSVIARDSGLVVRLRPAARLPPPRDLQVRAEPCLHLRAGPSSTSDSLTCLPAGTRLQSLAGTPGWWRVRLGDGREGWVSEEFVTAAALPVAAGPGDAPAPAFGPAPQSRPSGTGAGAAEAALRATIGRLEAELDEARAEAERARAAAAAALAGRQATEESLAEAGAEIQRLAARLALLEAERAGAANGRTDEAAEEPVAGPEAPLEPLGWKPPATDVGVSEPEPVVEVAAAEVPMEPVLSPPTEEAAPPPAEPPAMPEPPSPAVHGDAPTAEVEQAAVEPVADPPRAPGPPAAEETEPATDEAGPAVSVEDLAPDPAADVLAWAAAWSDQRVEDYLAFYSAGFEPDGGLDLADWRALRRRRLTRPAFIEVSIGDLEIVLGAPSEASARFTQDFRSDTFQDRVVKRLELVHEGGRWRIARETVLATLSR